MKFIFYKEDKAFWIDKLNNGMDRGTIISELLKAALNPNYANSNDPAAKAAHNLLVNKIIASNAVADSIENVPSGNIKQALTSFMDINNKITDKITNEEIKNTIESKKDSLKIDSANLQNSLTQNSKSKIISDSTGMNQKDVEKILNEGKQPAPNPDTKPKPEDVPQKPDTPDNSGDNDNSGGGNNGGGNSGGNNPSPKPPQADKEVDIANFLTEVAKPENKDIKFIIKDTTENINKDIQSLINNKDSIKSIASTQNDKALTLAKDQFNALTSNKLSKENTIKVTGLQETDKAIALNEKVDEFSMNSWKDFLRVNLEEAKSIKSKALNNSLFVFDEASTIGNAVEDWTLRESTLLNKIGKIDFIGMATRHNISNVTKELASKFADNKLHLDVSESSSAIIDIIRLKSVEKFLMESGTEFNVRIYDFKAIKDKMARGDKVNIKDSSREIKDNLELLIEQKEKINAKGIDSKDNKPITIGQAKFEIIKEYILDDDNSDSVYQIISGTIAMMVAEPKNGKATTWQHNHENKLYQVVFSNEKDENSDIKFNPNDGKIYDEKDNVVKFGAKTYKIYDEGGYRVKEQYDNDTGSPIKIVRNKFDTGQLVEKIIENHQFNKFEKLVIKYQNGNIVSATNKDNEYGSESIEFEVSSDNKHLNYTGDNIYLRAGNNPERLAKEGGYGYKGTSTVIDSALKTKKVVEFGSDKTTTKFYKTDGSPDKVILIAEKANESNFDTFDIAETIKQNNQIKTIQVKSDTKKFITGNTNLFATLDHINDRIKLPANITELTNAESDVNSSNLVEKLSKLGTNEAKFFTENIGGDDYVGYIVLNTDGVEGYQKDSDVLLKFDNFNYSTTFRGLQDGFAGIKKVEYPQKAAPTPTEFKQTQPVDVDSEGKATTWQHEESPGKVYKFVFKDKKVVADTVVKFADGVFFDQSSSVYTWQGTSYLVDDTTPNVNITQELVNKENGRVKESYKKEIDSGNLVKQTMEITTYQGQTEKIIAKYEGGKVKKAESLDHYEYANQKIVFDVDQVANSAELLDYQGRLYLSVTDYDLFIIENGIKKYKGTSTITDKVVKTKSAIEFKANETVYKNFENDTSDKVTLISKTKGSPEYFDIKETLEINSELKDIKIKAGNSKIGFIGKGEKIKLPDSINKLTKVTDVDLANVENELSALKVNEAQYFLENVGSNEFNAYIALNTDGNVGYQAGSDVLSCRYQD